MSCTRQSTKSFGGGREPPQVEPPEGVISVRRGYYAMIEKIEATDVHRDVVLTRRAMDSLGIDYMVVFSTPMLFLGNDGNGRDLTIPT